MRGLLLLNSVREFERATVRGALLLALRGGVERAILELLRLMAERLLVRSALLRPVRRSEARDAERGADRELRSIVRERDALRVARLDDVTERAARAELILLPELLPLLRLARRPAASAQAPTDAIIKAKIIANIFLGFMIHLESGSVGGLKSSVFNVFTT